MKKPVVAIVGATGAVGAEFVGCLTKRNFPVGRLKALASARSAGKTVKFGGNTIAVVVRLSVGSGCECIAQVCTECRECRRGRCRQFVGLSHGG